MIDPEAINTIRDALENPSYYKACKALAALDHLAVADIKMPEDDREFATKIGHLAIECGLSGDYTYRDRAAALITADRERGRREQKELFRDVLKECLECMTERRGYANAWEYKYGERWDKEDAMMKAAIMGTEVEG